MTDAEIKKQEASDKLDFNLHVALIQKQDGVNKSRAQFVAWLEGKGGLRSRLNLEG